MDYLIKSLTFIAIYGISYGMILFLISVGMVLTMGLMRVVNLAHGAFAAIGGYLAVYLMTTYGVPFILALIASTLAVAALGVVAERTIYVRIYRASELDQVLLTIGLLFITAAVLNFLFGPNILPSKLPHFLDAQVAFAGRSVQIYRLFVVAAGLVVIPILWYLLDRTRFGACLRAGVENRSMAEAVGIDVRRLFALALALGSGLAALGGAIGYAMLPLEPLYPFKYLVLIMIVVALSGFGNVKSAAIVSIALGVVDTAGKYFLPSIGAFIIYGFLVIYLLARMEGGILRRSA